MNWIEKMQGNFYIYALVFSSLLDVNVDTFHQKCLKKINDIKKEAYERKLKNDRSPLAQQNKSCPMDREANSPLLH